MLQFLWYLVQTLTFFGIVAFLLLSLHLTALHKLTIYFGCVVQFAACSSNFFFFFSNPKFAGRLGSTPALGGMLKNTCQFVFNISPLLSIFVDEEAASTFLSHYSGCVSNSELQNVPLHTNI